MPPTRTYDNVVKRIVSFESKVDRVLEHRNVDPATELEQETRIDANEVGPDAPGDVLPRPTRPTNPKSPNGMAALVEASMITNGNNGAPARARARR